MRSLPHPPLDQYIEDDVVHLIPCSDQAAHLACVVHCPCEPDEHPLYPIVYHHIMLGAN